MVLPTEIFNLIIKPGLVIGTLTAIEHHKLIPMFIMQKVYHLFTTNIIERERTS